MEITTLGPDGTHASQGVKKFFPDAEVRFESSIREVLDASGVRVLPLENSIEGTVRLSWDGILDRGLSLSGIFKMPISHVLGAQGGDFNKVISHPQAIAQCKGFIGDREVLYSSSTAEAVKMAAQDSSLAAIASEYACEIYGLPVLSRGVEDEEGNETIFGVIAEEDVFPDLKKDEMHIMVTPKKNMPGLLFDILKPFHDYGVDFTRLESRPTRKKLGDYRFLLSFKLDQNVGAVLGILKERYGVVVLGRSVGL
ncbi:MAG: prephenate dehydratase domain-containing protein [Patescibacteria group bacterium]|nr:hypothetical protein [Patescibacteria group bacterium]